MMTHSQQHLQLSKTAAELQKRRRTWSPSQAAICCEEGASQSLGAFVDGAVGKRVAGCKVPWRQQKKKARRARSDVMDHRIRTYVCIFLAGLLTPLLLFRSVLGSTIACLASSRSLDKSL